MVKNIHVSKGYFHLIGRSHQDKTLRSTRRRGTAGWKRRREPTKRNEMKNGGDDEGFMKGTQVEGGCEFNSSGKAC